jgi:glucose/arabinose dehydrogenase
VAVLVASACGGPTPSVQPSAAPSTTPTTAAPTPAATATGAQPTARKRPGTPQVLATGLQAPWGLAFLPDGSALVSERDTRRIVQVSPTGSVRQVDVVEEADANGEGGLLGIAVSKDYARDRWVYAYYTTSQDNRIARFRLGQKPEVLVEGIPVSGIHNGGRLAFGPDGMLYAGTGDASERGLSADVRSLGGKVLRMTPTGQPAPGNPIRDSLVFTSGHRNVQGLGFDAAGRLYASEFGQNTFDEVNLLQAGRDYGWPTVEGNIRAEGKTRPLLTWAPEEASPSGAVVAGGSFWVAALRGQRLWQVPLDGKGGVGQAVPHFEGDYGRLRHVALEPSGKALWVLTSNRDGRGQPTRDDDRVLRIPLV